MENGKIPDDKITASSSDFNRGPSLGRLNLEVQPGIPGGWSTPKRNLYQWLQIDLGMSPRNVTGIGTQGGTSLYGKTKWVTKYKLQYSDDGVQFKSYKGQGQVKVKEFDANQDGDTIKYNELDPPISARYIRVQPTGWNGRITMRLELYGCEEIKPCDSNPCLNGGNCTNEAGGNYSCQCPIGWMGDRCQTQIKVLRNCAEIYKSGNKTSGVYKINPDDLGEFEVFCDQNTAGGGWTVFQKRFDGSVDFNRGWDDYRRGFGNLNGEFWLGLDKIHRLTVSSKNKLRVDLEDVPGNTAFAEYSSFDVGSEVEKYKLSLGNYSGSAGDSLAYHRGYSFSTNDRDNDGKPSGNCASFFTGG